MAALRSYSHRNFKAELRGWIEDMQHIVDAASKLPGVRSELRFPQPGGRRVPHAVISIDPAVASLSADEVVVALQEGEPPIYVFERHAREGLVVFMPEPYRWKSQIIAGRLTEILRR